MDKIFDIITYLLKDTFKVDVQYVFNIFVIIKTVFYLKHNIKLKIDPKT